MSLKYEPASVPQHIQTTLDLTHWVCGTNSPTERGRELWRVRIGGPESTETELDSPKATKRFETSV